MSDQLESNMGTLSTFYPPFSQRETTFGISSLHLLATDLLQKGSSPESKEFTGRRAISFLYELSLTEKGSKNLNDRVTPPDIYS